MKTMKKRKKYLFGLLGIFLLLTACTTNNQYESKSRENTIISENSEIQGTQNLDYPENYNKTEGKVTFYTNIIVDNKDEKFIETTATLQKINIDKAIKILYSDITDYEKYESDTKDEYGNDTKSVTLVSPEETTISYGSTSSVMNYMKRSLVPYVLSAFRLDDGYDDYNANKYSIEDQLDFMSREEAYAQIEKVLSEIGIDIDSNYRGYALDYKTLQEEEYHEDMNGKEDIANYKKEWTSENNCYYFSIDQELRGLPVHHVYAELFPEISDMNSPIQAVISANGIESLAIERIFDFDKNTTEVNLTTFDQIAGVISKKYNNILGDSTYEVSEARLYYYVDILSGDGIYKVKPVWIVNIIESTPEGKSNKKIQMIIDAQTAEEIVI